MGVGCQEGSMAVLTSSSSSHSSSPWTQNSLRSTRSSSLACPGHSEHGNVFPSLELLWLQPALPCSSCCSHSHLLSAHSFSTLSAFLWKQLDGADRKEQHRGEYLQCLGCLSGAVLGLFPQQPPNVEINHVPCAEQENQESRVSEIHSLVHRLPEKNRQMLHLLMNHLAKYVYD